MNILQYLLKPEIAVVFDVDGVLAPYEFGYLSHSMSDEEWDEMVSNGINPYSAISYSPKMRKWAKRGGCKPSSRYRYSCRAVEESRSAIHEPILCAGRQQTCQRSEIFWSDQCSRLRHKDHPCKGRYEREPYLLRISGFL